MHRSAYKIAPKLVALVAVSSIIGLSAVAAPAACQSKL